MGKKSKLALMAAVIFTLGSCSGDGGNVEVKISSSPYPLIPAEAKSCLVEGDPEATYDISPYYFRIPKITFNRKNLSKDLIISLIRIRIAVPGSQSGIDCTVGGDNLLALATTWDAAGEALIGAGGTESFATNCALYCGGIDVNGPFIATGTMEVFGLERDPASEEEVPVMINTSVSVRSY